MAEFPPSIPLHGGPYDEWTTAELAAHENAEHGVLFFPDRIVATGPEGRHVYVVGKDGDAVIATFDPEASE
jgi:hypothetical protein